MISAFVSIFISMILFLSTFVSMAHAQQAPAAGPSALESFLPIIFMLVIFYILIIRPQSRRMKEQQKTLEALKRGDSVLTNSGILGRIEGLTDKYVTLEIADGVRVKMLKNQIAGLAKENP